MLSWPDFEEKQVVYIGSKEIKDLCVKNSNLVSKEDGKVINQVPFAKIFAVFLEGEATFTSVLIKKLAQNGIILILLNHNLHTYCVIGGETEGNFLLREKQYKDTEQCNKSIWIVTNKIQNQLILLKKIRKKNDAQKEAIKFLKRILRNLNCVDDPKRLLGMEGSSSKIFFNAYFGDFKWYGRKPRTKFDEKNTLLDIGYTLLFNFIEAHVRLYGFDLYKGFYHTDFYQRKSLVCDLVEPFRCIIDHALYRSLALKQFDEKDFKVRNGQYFLRTEKNLKYKKIFLEAIMAKKEDIFKFIQSFYRTTIKEESNYPIFLISK